MHAVRGIDLELAQGEIVAFLGPNGAGKTTTIDMVLGLSTPTTGDVEVLGLEPRDAIARGLVSAVMQTGGLLKDLTVRETVRYTASLFADTEDVDTVLKKAGITGIADRKVGKCSGGEQQRLRFAMALLLRPRAAAARRAHHRHGRRGPPRLLVRDPRGRRPRPHRALRDALPRGGRPVRRPHRPHQQGPDRRRRHRRPGEGDDQRPHAPRHPPRRRPGASCTSWPPSAASTASRPAASP